VPLPDVDIIDPSANVIIVLLFVVLVNALPSRHA
jgi:hypothetical protein